VLWLFDSLFWSISASSNSPFWSDCAGQPNKKKKNYSERPKDVALIVFSLIKIQQEYQTDIHYDFLLAKPKF
jgi:hypothetical protein